MLFFYAAQDKLSSVHLKLNEEEQKEDEEGVSGERHYIYSEVSENLLLCKFTPIVRTPFW